MVLFLFMVLVAVALGIVGVVVDGLFYLLFVGIAVFLLGFVVFGAHLRGRRRRPAR